MGLLTAAGKKRLMSKLEDAARKCASAGLDGRSDCKELRQELLDLLGIFELMGDADFKKALDGAFSCSCSSDAPWLLECDPGHDEYEWLVSKLLSLGADPNAVDKDGRSALLSNAQLGNFFILDKLLAAGADPRMAGPDGLAPWQACLVDPEGFSDGEQKAHWSSKLLALAEEKELSEARQGGGPSIWLLVESSVREGSGSFDPVLFHLDLPKGFNLCPGCDAAPARSFGAPIPYAKLSLAGASILKSSSARSFSAVGHWASGSADGRHAVCRVGLGCGPSGVDSADMEAFSKACAKACGASAWQEASPQLALDLSGSFLDCKLGRSASMREHLSAEAERLRLSAAAPKGASAGLKKRI